MDLGLMMALKAKKPLFACLYFYDKKVLLELIFISTNFTLS